MRSSVMDEPAGRVYLVGAGPGAADLITIRAAEVLRRAEVVFYDSLINPALLDFAPAGAELIYAGKRGNGERAIEQIDLHALMLDRARAGLRVVRLKGGDPFVFARGGEEAQALARAGIPFEIVPGVTSAIAAPAFAGIPLTHREHGSFVTFVTGHENQDKGAETVPWDDLARAAAGRGTIVILMGAARIGGHLRRLAAGGLSIDTPAAAVQWGTTAGQRTVIATLGTLAGEVQKAGLGAPMVIVVGQSAALGRELGWFERLALFGRRIVITRAREHSGDLAREIGRLGAEVIEFPTIRIEPPPSYDELDQAISRLDEFDWVIFTSANGVESFIARLDATGHDIRELGRARIGAIGPATARRLRGAALMPAVVPGEYRAEAIVDEIGPGQIAGLRFLIPRALVARDVLPRMLIENGAREVAVVPAYRTVKAEGRQAERVGALLRSGAIDLVAFTSSSTVNNFCELVGDIPAGTKAAAIGPITAATARDRGFDVAACPAEYTVPALVRAIRDYFTPAESQTENQRN